MNYLTFRVYGEPVPQGSKTARAVGNKAVMWEANPRSREWREQISQAAWQASEGNTWDEAVEVMAVFYLPKPKSVRRDHATRTYDVDKLCRNLLDAIGGAKSVTSVIANDSLVVDLYARKVWANEANPPGVWVYVRPLGE